MKETIIASTVLILCIVLLRHLCKEKISARLQYTLWLIVAVRLIMPGITELFPNFLPESNFSIMNVADKVEEAAQDHIPQPQLPAQFSLPVGGLPFLTGTSEDGPTAVFLAGTITGTWIDFIRTIWYIGMVVAGTWMLIVNIRFMRMLHKSRTRYEKEDFKLPIYLVKDISSPCLYGLPGNQAVYLPEEVAGDEEKVKHILAHEYCHYRHKDVFWSAFRCVLVIVYWFHPFVWLAAVLSKQDCELACDEAAIRMLGEEERIAYGKTLLSLITRKTKASDIVCTATTMTAGAEGIKERIRRIAEKPHRLAIVLLPVLVVVGVVVTFTFTQAKNAPKDIQLLEGGDSMTVTTGCFQMTFPNAFDGKAYYSKENDTDVIVYHKDSDREIGRFCRMPYEEAWQLAVVSGKEVVLIGSYGSNLELQNGRNGVDSQISDDMQESGTAHTYYTPAEDTQGMLEHEDIFESEGGSGDGGIPGLDSNHDDTTYLIEDETIYLPDEEIQEKEKDGYAYGSFGGAEPIPAPEDVDKDVINLPYDEEDDYNAGTISEGETDYLANEEVTVTYNPSDGTTVTEHTYYPSEESADETTAQGVPGQDEASALSADTADTSMDTTYVLPEESITAHPASENSTDYPPNEEIRKVSVYLATEKPCYLYIPADNSDADERIQAELTQMNQMLTNMADSVNVLYLSMESMQKTLKILAENRTSYVSDFDKLTTIADALPENPELRFGDLQIEEVSEPDAAVPVTLSYNLETETLEQTDKDILFLNAVLMFASIENLNQCNMTIQNHYVYNTKDEFYDAFINGKLSTEISYERSRMEELFGPLYPSSETEEDFADLYNRVLEYLREKN